MSCAVEKDEQAEEARQVWEAAGEAATQGFESDRTDISHAQDKSLIKFVLEPSPYSVEDVGLGARPSDGAIMEAMFSWFPLPFYEEDYPDPYDYMGAAHITSQGTTKIRFTLGECEVCDALELTVASMRKLETCVVRCGARGSTSPSCWTDESLGLVPRALEEGGPRLPLDFMVTLLSCEREKDNVMDMTPSERVSYASGRKNAAAKYFKAERYDSASKRYRMVSAVLDFTGDFKNEDLLSEAKALRCIAKQNEAACRLKLADTNGAIAACTDALRIDSQSEKALYRRASAYLKQGNFALAQADLKQCLAVNPENREAQRLLQQTRSDAKRTGNKEKLMYAKMLSGDTGS